MSYKVEETRAEQIKRSNDNWRKMCINYYSKVDLEVLHKALEEINYFQREREIEIQVVENEINRRILKCTKNE